MSAIRVVYIAGPLDANSPEAQQDNIERARQQAFEVWRRGLVALCPHSNNATLGTLPRAVWLRGELELLRRCDALLLVQGWETSEGTLAERAEAARLGLPIFTRIADLDLAVEAES